MQPPRPLPAVHRAVPWLLVVASALGAAARPAAAQDPHPATDGAAAEAEDRARIEDLVQSLNNPVVARVPDELRQRIDRLLAARHPLAREALRAILRDTGARTAVVEQIVVGVLIDPHASDLVDDVVERLRIEQDSALAQRLDEPLLRWADTALVRRLAELAVDPARTRAYRLTAIGALGRTGHGAALAPLLDLWNARDAEVRLAASRAFVRIVPFVSSKDEAAAVLAQLEGDALPLAEIFRRRLRELGAPHTAVRQSSYEAEYVALARAALPRLPLEDVLRLGLASPLPDLRSAAAARLLSYPFDAEADPAAARIAAGKALLDALREEESATPESDLLDALFPLAAAVRENVSDDEMRALTSRVRAGGRTPLAVRRAAIRVLGALRDPRPVAVLEQEFDALRDTDPEVRIELLDALAASARDVTGWLSRRALEERDVRVARRMVLLLGQATDPAAAEVFVALVRDAHPDDTVRYYAAQALARLWAYDGLVEARDALVRYGLSDPALAVREVSVNGLANARPGDRAPVLAALERALARPDEDAKVRVAAARALLDLDAAGALARLAPHFVHGAVWDVYRARRVEDLRGAHVSVEDILHESDALWTMPLEGARPRALDLLQAVVDAGTGLYEGRSGRGVVRERLARRLIEAGRPLEACAVAESLLAQPPRDDDPRVRWRLLLARAQRATGVTERVQKAERDLLALAGEPGVSPDTRALAVLERAHALLLLGDPSEAQRALAAIDELAAARFDEEDVARLRRLRADAKAGSDAERARVLELAQALDTRQDAREALAALGWRAARQIDDLLGGAPDLARARPLVRAAGVLVGRELSLAETATPAQVAEAVREARLALSAYLTRPSAGNGSR